MKKSIFLVIAVLLFAGLQAQQSELKMQINISGAIPGSSLKDLTNNASLRGGEMGLLYGVSNKLSVGLQVAYQDFYEKFPRAIYKLDDGSDISAVLTNSVQVIPILATVRYEFTPEARLRPYVAAGLGGGLSFYKQYLGEYPSSANKFGFAARPEAGVYLPFKPQSASGLLLGVYYNYMSYNKYGIKDLSYMGAKLGVVFPLRD
ncbi:MAG: outer membrane beta-barrel protein [Chitinophagaceae bacterium]|nr:outer membrane beta-barrel protein [Chitinophagaceae bacterium]